MAEIIPNYAWYQSKSDVVVEVFIKNPKAENSIITFNEDEVNVRVNTVNENKQYVLSLYLSDKIVSSSSIFQMYPSKIELKLKKLNSNKMWTCLEKNKQQPKTNVIFKDWDRITNTDETGADPRSVIEVFQDIYSQGNDEVRKAMEKSFYESNGTVLSTNWNEVKEKKVDTHNVEGVEFRKWD